jgi:hypothetical protein
LSAVGRLVRRICLARALDQPAEGARLEQEELPAAVHQFQLVHGLAALPESELRAIFTREEQRVADAMILSELLVPTLLKALSVPPAAPGPVPSSSPWREPSAPRPNSAAPVGGSPAIPDLLDAMLAAELTGRRA